MSNVVLASNEADSAAVETALNLHAELSGTLAGHAARVIDSLALGDQARTADARDELTAWLAGPVAELLNAEAAGLGPSLREIDPESADRVAKERDHVNALIVEFAHVPSTSEAAAAVTALRAQLGQYFRAQEDYGLPVLAQSSEVPLATLWGRIEGKANISTAEDQDVAAGHVCECGVVDEPELPELDVRTVPHAIRHATVLGALDAVPAGSGLILVAPHDPLPLLAQIEQRAPGRFEVSYLERGPQAWRLQLSDTGRNVG